MHTRHTLAKRFTINVLWFIRTGSCSKRFARFYTLWTRFDFHSGTVGYFPDDKDRFKTARNNKNANVW